MGTEFQSEGTQPTNNPWQTLSVCQVYDNPWIEVLHHEVINPSGGAGIYGVVRFKNVAIGIIPIDAFGYTWLVGQYRYTLGRYSWEIPEGGGPLGIPILESAQRELLEETGIRAKKWTLLLESHLSNSVTTEFGMVYLAENLEFCKPQPEDTELLQVARIPFEEAVNMVLDGIITDAISVMALLKANELRRQNKLIF